ncbi:hypothetical protein GCM10010140_66410 [Streptosporangium pseudovulgare]|uniref:Uncharacterized protein n=1 Tax=Streptosporangium pseudovulgare TaxID=35765 RepID=A0ABQ2RHF6_9ACTN|nr:hypothetical protein GCM10010140_66410 [Streptosporangium pseudovulgare]
MAMKRSPAKWLRRAGGKVPPRLEVFPPSAQQRGQHAAESFRERFNDSLDVMSADYDEQPGGAGPAIDTFVPLPRRGPAVTRRRSSAVGGGSGPGETQGGPQRIAEMSA